MKYAKCDNEPPKAQKRKIGNSAVKLAGQPKPGARYSEVEGDHEPCAMCKVAYGDASDPKKREIWECCKRCRLWWHETCAALSGTYSKQNVFVCDRCVKKKKMA